MNGSLQERTGTEYRRRINLVIQFMQDNLDKKISIGELAAVSCFSAFHFQHIFKAFTGYSILKYLNRLRLNSAAHKLLYRPDLTVARIAQESHFSSASDFTRAFKQQFKTAPIKYRAMKKQKIPAETPQTRFTPDKRIDSRIRIQKIANLKLAYILCTGLSRQRRNKTISGAFKRLAAWAGLQGFTGPDTRLIGIYPDNPEFMPLDECRYYACLSVPGHAAPEAEIGILEPDFSGNYAVIRFNPRAPFFHRQFFKAVFYLYKDWIPGNGYLPDNKPMFELYVTENNRLKYMDFHIPVILYTL